MEDPTLALGLTGLFLLMALLYSSVGLGGGSGYLAAMALLGVAPDRFRIIALTLNVVVSAIGLVKFARAGHFNGRLLFPFVLASVPLAFVGGYFTLPAQLFRLVVGVALIWAAVLLIWKPPKPEGQVKSAPPPWVSMAVGGAIGLLSGLIGIGGGVFLAPFLILRGWASARTTACVSSAFILANSLSALAGVATHAQEVPSFLPVWMVAVAMGGWLGAELGSKRLHPRTMHWILAVILVVAGARIMVSG
jgi:uncharacterized membrane protein YfcA